MKFDGCVQDQGHSRTSKCQWMFVLRYLLNCRTFYYKTLHGHAFSWARVSFKIVLLFSMSRSQWRIIWSNTIDISSELLILLLQLNLVWWHIITSWIALQKDWIALLWSRSRLRIWLNVYVDEHISSIVEPVVTRLGMVIHHHGPVSCKTINLPSSRSRPQWGLI